MAVKPKDAFQNYLDFCLNSFKNVFLNELHLSMGSQESDAT